MNAILLLIIAALIALFGAQQTNTEQGMAPADDTEVPDDGADENGEVDSDMFTFNIED